MLFLIIIPCILCFVYAWRRRRRYLQGRLPPSCRFSWPIVGLLHLWLRWSFWNKLLDIQLGCLKQGCVALMYSGINPRYLYYVICDYEDSNKVADSCLEKSFLLENSMKDVLGNGLVTAPVTIWKTRRSLLETAFEEISKNKKAVSHQASILVEAFERNAGKAFNPRQCLGEAIMRTLCVTLLGVEADDKDFSKNAKICKRSMDKITRELHMRHKNIMMHNEFLYNCSTIKSDLVNESSVLNDLISEVIKIKKSEINDVPSSDSESHKSDTENRGLADILIEYEAKGIYTEEEIIKEIMTMMFSGYNKISNVLANVLCLFGYYPDVQERVNKELKDVPVDTTNLQTYVYLEAVVMETLRLYPPVTMISRLVEEEVKLKKYVLDPGSKCLLSIYGMHRHPLWGDDKDQFKPERWLHSDAPSDRFAAFGIGKRCCIAKQFALSWIMEFLIKIMREFNVKPTDVKMENTQEIFLTPDPEYHITLKRKRVPV